jgi:hypothetical protein
MKAITESMLREAIKWAAGMSITATYATPLLIEEKVQEILRAAPDVPEPVNHIKASWSEDSDPLVEVFHAIEPIKGKVDRTAEKHIKNVINGWKKSWSVSLSSRAEGALRDRITNLLTAYGPPASGGVDLSKIGRWTQLAVMASSPHQLWVKFDDLRVLLQDTAKEQS